MDVDGTRDVGLGGSDVVGSNAKREGRKAGIVSTAAREVFLVCLRRFAVKPALGSSERRCGVREVWRNCGSKWPCGSVLARTATAIVTSVAENEVRTSTVPPARLQAVRAGSDAGRDACLTYLDSRRRADATDMPAKSEVKAGDAISVYWPEDRKWYDGQVESINAISCTCEVLYDDGERGLLNLLEEKYKVKRGGEGDRLIDRVRASNGDVSKQLDHIGAALIDMCKCFREFYRVAHRPGVLDKLSFLVSGVRM